jgi:hypothetical protein
MIASILSHFRGNPLCVGCEQHRVVHDYLCQYCLEKLAELDKKGRSPRKSPKLRLV